jgi:hypothetical protein
VSTTTIIVEAVFDGTVLRPFRPLPLSPQQRVMVTISVPGTAPDWPEDVAAIYGEINAEDRRLAEAAFPTVRQTWPPHGEGP